MSAFLKNILFALALALILWLGYRVFFGGEDAPLTAQNAMVISEASRDTEEFLRTLQQLRGIQLNGELFADTRFQSLHDYRQPIVAESVGRSNPFAPIGQ